MPSLSFRTDQPCWRVCDKNLNIVSMCAVSPVVHTSHISSCQKNVQFSCGCEQFHEGRSFGFLFINVCNHEGHYETPRIILSLRLQLTTPCLKQLFIRFVLHNVCIVMNISERMC
jgi:hypothetical protein